MAAAKKKTHTKRPPRQKKKPKPGQGAKGKWHSDIPMLVEGLFREGYTDKDVAKYLKISIQTFYVWAKEKIEFSEAIKKGKAPVDYQVENQLLKRALGFDYEEVHQEAEMKWDEKAKKMVPTPTKVKRVKKHVPPDVGACMAWLKNRRPDKWRDKWDVELLGKLEIAEAELREKLGNLSEADLEKLAYGLNPN